MTLNNQESLIRTFSDSLLQGHHYSTIAQARNQAETVLGIAVRPGDSSVKVVDESMEAAVVRVAGAIVQDSDTTHRAYDRLVELLEQQPNLGVRTSTSIMQQAYSTPIPIAFLAASLAEITPETTVYEPTAGNGALLINADPRLVLANELNGDRFTELSKKGFGELMQEDAMTYRPPEKVDRVIANPPFGTIADQNGESQKFRIYQTWTTQIDQVIAFNSLEAMKADGKAVLILGGKLGRTEEARSTRYHSRESRAFFKQLYDRYNVIDHFSIDGGLYRKQGAGFPIDLIVIDGQGQSDRRLPAADVPEIFTSFTALKEKLPDVSLSRLSANLDADRERIVLHSQSSRSIQITTTEELPRTDGAAPGMDDEPRFSRRRTGLFETGIPPDLSRPTDPDPRPGGLEIGMGHDDRSLHRILLQPQRNSSRSLSSDTDRSTTPGLSESIGQSQRDHFGRLVEQSITENVMTDFDLEPKQVAYLPRSLARPIGTLIPVNMADAAQQALDNFEVRNGNIDDYLVEKLGYTDRINLYQHFSAEQVDGAALAIASIEAGKGFVIGDQTGIGKGRICAAVMRYAKEEGLEAIFISQNPGLYADIVRDLQDIGMTDFNPWMTDAGKSIPLPNGTTLRTGNLEQQKEIMQNMIDAGGTGRDAVFTTYSQVQTVSGGVEPMRREFLRAIAPNAILVLDEAHEAGGGAKNDWKGKNDAPDRAEFIRELVDASKGAFFSSATAIKRPDVIDLYARKTDLRHAVKDVDDLSLLLNEGGVPLQQMVAAGMVEGGDMRRLERSYEGISFKAEVVPVDRNVVENLASAMRSIKEFDDAKRSGVKELKEQAKEQAQAISEDNAIGQAGVSSSNFTSLMHNCISQTLVALKAEETVQLVISQLQNNEKPVIALSNTMGTVIKWYAEEHDVKPGDEIDLSFADLLNRYLDRSRDIIVKDYAGKSERRPLTGRELGLEGQQAFADAREIISSSDFSSIPISPIDYIKSRLHEEGYSVGEITGRRETLQYQEDGSTTLKLRSSAELKTNAKIETVKQFNSGNLDVLILNKSGATGISLHASETFADQRPRHMNILQAAGDINEFVQMLGRVNRTGQVVPPNYSLVMSDIPAEKRPGAILMKKMAFLNANTTAARESNLSLTDVVDFMNPYGEQVVMDLLSDDYELDAALGNPLEQLRKAEIVTPTALIEKVTGRIPILPLADQEHLYATIEDHYKSLIESQRAIGDNQLEAGRLDLDARTIAQMEFKPAIGDRPGPFASAVHIEVIDVKSTNKPLTQLQIVNAVRETLGLSQVDNLGMHDRNAVQITARQQVSAKVRSLQDAADLYEDRVTQKYRDPEKADRFSGKLGEQVLNVASALRTYPTGTPIVLSTPEPGRTTLYGVIEDVKKAHQSTNPAAASDWKLHVLVADGAQRVKIPLSQIKENSAHHWQVSSMAMNTLDTSPYALFDINQTESREQRQVCTGNLIRAFDAFNGGRFVHFTTTDGDIRQGLLMPRDFDATQTLNEQSVDLKTVDNVRSFIDHWTEGRGIARTPDNHLRIHQSSEGWVLNASPTRTDGGKFFLNSALLEAIGDDFVSCNGAMRATVPDDQIESVLDIVMSQHPLLTSNHHDIARNFLDISLPEFSAVQEQPKTKTTLPIPPEIVQAEPDAMSPMIDVTTSQTEIITEPIVEPITETFTQGGLFEIATIQSPSAISEFQEECFEYTIECVEEEEPSMTAEDFQTWRKQAQEIGRSFKHLKQIDKLQRQFETDPTPLSDRAQQVRADDQKTWGEQVSAVIGQALHILESKGTPTANGNLFQGNIYQISGNENRLSIHAIDRGQILHLEQDEIHSTLTHQDAARFSAHTKFLESREAVPQPIALER